MPESPPKSLLDCRLVIVTGKGGCGKTTVAAAVALGAAERGLRVALVEMGRDEHLHGLIKPGSSPVGYEGRELSPSLWVFHIDPFAALAEYLGLQIGMQSLVEKSLNQPAFRQLLAAAPGWRELITLGKIGHIENFGRDAGKLTYDLIVVDAPASGHGLTFLDVPRVVQSAIKTGPLRRRARDVEALIQDPERTRLLPVSLAEELPVRETAELIGRVRDDIGTPLDRVVVNRVLPHPFDRDYFRDYFSDNVQDLAPDSAHGSDASDNFENRLAALPRDTELGCLPSPQVLAKCSARQRARFELNDHYVRELAKRVDLPLISIGEVPGGIQRKSDLLLLAEQLFNEPTAHAGSSDAENEASSQ